MLKYIVNVEAVLLESDRRDEFRSSIGESSDLLYADKSGMREWAHQDSLQLDPYTLNTDTGKCIDEVCSSGEEVRINGATLSWTESNHAKYPEWVLGES
jgi:hypothetical protein